MGAIALQILLENFVHRETRTLTTNPTFNDGIHSDINCSLNALGDLYRELDSDFSGMQRYQNALKATHLREPNLRNI